MTKNLQQLPTKQTLQFVMQKKENSLNFRIQLERPINKPLF